MADGLCTGGDLIGGVIEKTAMKSFVDDTNDSAKGPKRANVNGFYIASESDNLFDKVCGGGQSSSGDKHLHPEGFLNGSEEDCRKKRCVDRYDSSESSDR